MLPQTDLVVAAGVTVVNKTINRVAELARGLLAACGWAHEAHAAGGLRGPQGRPGGLCVC